MKTIELTIDGMTVTGKPGETVLQVARHHHISIPFLCNHMELEPYGGCRMCLVAVAGMRRLATACTLQIAPGMEVTTTSPEIEKARRTSLELLLADHPNECLTCAKNQQCELQALAAEYGIDRVRFRKTRPTLPRDDSNPFFAYDPNKCILCARCVRTCTQLQGLGAIDLINRGINTVVGCANRVPWVDSICESCGECISRCPTGALSDRIPRPPQRKVKTTCTFCGTGCSMLLGVRGQQVVSVSGDRTSPVNRGRLCVKGRYGVDFVNSPNRLKTPLIKRNGVFEEATWDEALDLIAAKFKEYKGSEIAVQGSARCSNEENYVAQKLARAVFHTNNVDNCARLCHAPTVAGLSKAFGTSGGTNPLDDLPHTGCIFVIGSNTTEAHPVAGSLIRRLTKAGKPLIVADPRKIDLAKHADIWMAQKPGTDVPLLMGMARVIIDEGLHNPDFIAERCENYDAFLEALKEYDLDTVERITTVPKEQIIAAARMYASAETAIIVYSLGITEHSHGVDNVLGLANLALITGNVGKPYAGVMPMRGQNNVQGACDMGCIPNAFQGYQYVSKPEVREKFAGAWGAPMPEEPGLGLVDQINAVLEDRIKAFYIIGIDPAYSVPDANKVWAAFRKAEFVVFQDIFLTGSAQFADVVLPGASFAEKEGTFTNLERRVQRIRKAIEPVGDSRPDWWITCEIARRMGAQGFDYADPAAIMDEIARLTPTFAGVSFARLESNGIQWPCSDCNPEEPGTPRLHVHKFNTPSGLGHLADLHYRPSAELPDAEYPFLLMTGRNLYHYHMAMTTQVDGLLKLYPEEKVRINPEDAARLGINHGDTVKVSSRRGAVCVKAWVTDESLPGQAFMTFHFYDQPTNVVCNPALDPVSKTPEFKVAAIRIEKVAPEAMAEINEVNPAAIAPRSV